MTDPSPTRKLRVDRRRFLAAGASAAAALATSPIVAAQESPARWSFGLLGDTHFDRLEHHDLSWLAADHPGDVEQVKRYSSHAATLLPKLFARIKALST